jgi:hypothetical protein
VKDRLEKGWSVERALTEPINQPRHLTHQGVTMKVKAWAEKLGVRRATLERRLRCGWTIDRVLKEAA